MRWSPRRPTFIAAGAVCLLLLGTIAVVVWGPGLLITLEHERGSHLSARDYLAAVASQRQLILWSLGGLLAAIGLIYTALRHRLAREQHELDRDANRTERYTAAVAQLGDRESVAIRLGGVYALGRIAIDSQRDSETVIQVLSAFVRDRSKELGEHDMSPTDVVAAVKVLAIQLPNNGMTSSGLDLVAANLRSADLAGARLGGAQMANANLANANLAGADLRGINLGSADLVGANLADADLRNAHLVGANLSGAFLDRVNFENAWILGASFLVTGFHGASLRHVRDWDRAQLEASYWDEQTEWPNGYSPLVENRDRRSGHM